MAEFGSLATAIKLARSSGTSLFCRYCGNETVAVGSKGVCSNCEMPVEQNQKAFSERNAEIFQTAKSIKSAVGKGDFDSAVKVYEEAFAKYRDPGMLYAESLVKIKQSNAAIAQIRYDRKGFMEENTAYRNSGAKLVSEAKLLLFKAISACNAAMAAGPTPGNAYLLFLCYSKIGNARASSNAIGLIEKAGNTYLSMYARMAYDSTVRDYKALERDSEAMLNSENFSVNALFYLALAALRNGNEKYAKSIMEGAKGFVGSSLTLLQKDMERFEQSLM